MNIRNSSISVYRHEDKYILNLVDLSLLKNKLDILLQRDPYSQFSPYPVRSLYFDSLNAKDLITKYAGVEERKKIRIRTYDPKKRRCKLEVKEKYGNLGHKISLWITKSEALYFCQGDFSALCRYFDTSEDAIRIYHEMIMGCYRPAVLVEYDRLAYVYPLFDTRITFDINIRGSESNFSLFDPTVNWSHQASENVILEVKYNKRLVDHISTILKPYHLVQTSVSKYCECRPIFTHFTF